MKSEAWQILVLLLLVATVVQGLVLVGVMRQLGGLLLRFPAPRPGDTGGGPEAGMLVEVADLRAQAGVMLFVAPGCGFCDELMPGLPSLARHFPDVQFIGVPIAPEAREREEYAKMLPIRTRTDLHELRATWNISGTPYAVGFDRGLRVVGSGAVNTIDQLEVLGAAAVHGFEDADEAVEPTMTLTVEEVSSNGAG